MNMNNLEAMRARISRRTYTNQLLDENISIQIQELINNINTEADLSFLLLEDGSEAFQSFRKGYGMFSGVRSILVLKGKKEDPHLREKAGYYGELLVIEATKLGLGTCWVGGTYDRKNPIFQVTEEEALVCVIPIGYVPEDKTFRERFIYRLSHLRSKGVDSFMESNTEIPAWIAAGLEAVQLAPSAMNSQKVRFQYVNEKVSIHISNTYVLDLVDLGIAKLHFELATDKKFPLGNNVELAL